MDLRLVTVAFDPETGAFPEWPLKDVEGEIVSVVEHFFHHLDLPHLLLIVHFRPPVGRGKRSRRQARGGDIRKTLGPDEADLFDRLRVWRNGSANADGVPPYVILTNQQLGDIARRRPTDIKALRDIHGIGEAKTSRYGKQILQVVSHAAGSLLAPKAKDDERNKDAG